jgi:Signal peptidase, peptidase S26
MTYCFILLLIIVVIATLSSVLSLRSVGNSNNRIDRIHHIPRRFTNSPSTFRRDGGNIIPPIDTNTAISSISDDGNENNTASSSTDPVKPSNPLAKIWQGFSPEAKEDIKTTSLSLIFALVVRLFILEPRYIPSLSMFPTFDIGDQLIVDKV